MTSIVTGNDTETSESPVLSTEFIKQNKNRIFNLYEAALKITYTAPNSDVVKGTIDLKDVYHIYFDTDNRFDTLTPTKKKDGLKSSGDLGEETVILFSVRGTLIFNAESLILRSQS